MDEKYLESHMVDLRKKFEEVLAKMKFGKIILAIEDGEIVGLDINYSIRKRNKNKK